MPYRSRIYEVSFSRSALSQNNNRLQAPASLNRNAFWPAIFPSLLLLLAPFSLPLQAQPAPVQASDIDWVSRDKLSGEQQTLINNNCCGSYIEPEQPEFTESADSTVINYGDLLSDGDGIWQLSEGVELLQPDIRISAQQGEYQQNSGQMTLENDVRLRQTGLLITGNSARIDQSAGFSEIREASYVMHANGLRGSADIILYRDAEGIVTIDNGTFTRCEPGDDSWLLTGSEIQLNQASGRGVARGVKLRVNNVPILYLPRISFPINDDRASGFLAPIMGSTRDGGFDIATPYYLNLAPNYDITLTPRMQIERGVMLGMETRYLGRNNRQQLNLVYLPDDKLYDPATRSIPGTDSPPTDARWLMDYSMSGRLSRQWTSSIDYKAVSDIDYFQDLGSNGLLNTTSSYLSRHAALNYRGEHWNFKAITQAYQLIDPNVSSSQEPYRIMPGMNLDGYFYDDSGIEYGVNFQYANFDRNLNPASFNQTAIDKGALVTGSRLAITPEISLPWSNNFAFVRPAAKYRYASWNLQDQALAAADTPNRGVFTASLDSGLIFEKDTSLWGNSLLQTLEPRLYYLYTEYEDQSDIPLFDSSDLTFSYSQLFRDNRFSGNDRIGDADQLTLALSTRLYDQQGQELLRASIGQIQYFQDRRVTLSSLPAIEANDSNSALVGEYNLRLGENWRSAAYLEWDSSDNAVNAASFQFQYQSDINHILNFGYRFRKVPGPAVHNGVKRRIDQTDISSVWPLNDRWGLIGRWNYDLANDRNLETLAGVEYSNCCWTMRVVARQWIDNDALYFGIDDDNTGIFLQFELKGLGSILGGNVSGILNNGISGYRERENAL